MNSDVTVILNGFKRKRQLTEQLNSINKQSVKPKDIMLWYNSPGSIFDYNLSAINSTIAAVSNHNFGVWSRFYFALNAKTKYVCIFDDDTMPGVNWLHNCLDTIKTHRGLLGSIGLIFNSKEDYYQHDRFGWANPNEEAKQVDIVGHSWFFEREFLTAFCRELPLLDVALCGEDIHFSYTLQKYFQLPTIVPPHPKDDKSLWGSTKGWKLGMDKHAISRLHINKKDDTFTSSVNRYYRECLKNDWQLINAL